jgi:hypothetical protein
MISRRLLKSEIDKVQSEYLDLLYSIIRLFEKDVRHGGESVPSGSVEAPVCENVDWHAFVAHTYGCLAETPISRGDQGCYESREAMK